MQVGEGVHRLTPGVCNFYLIEDGGRLVLVDAGAPGDWDLLVQTLPALGRRLEDLEAVLITHAHSDHTGFAERARTTAAAPVREPVGCRNSFMQLVDGIRGGVR